HQTLLLFTLLTMAILYLQTKSFVIIARSFRLLIWLFMPIFLLHSFFTPGTYIMGLPVSIEGLKQSFSLSLNLACMFFTALLVMNMIEMKHLLQVLKKREKLNQMMMPNLILLLRLRTLIPQALNMQRKYWQSLDHKWLVLPDVLFETILAILKSSGDEARLLWENWDKEMEQLVMVNHNISNIKASDLAFGALGVLALVSLYL
ncbi:MAG: hypothetical protein Q9N02_10790, partial [Ghiorsea sp.]|nr:hypothetical protein [Ghiorsea sp.]